MNGPIKIVAAVCLAMYVAPPAFGEMTLRYNQWVPRGHHSQSELMHPFFERIAAATEGRVKIVPTAAALGATQAQLDMVETGVADVVFSAHGYTPARFQLAEIALLPFSGRTAESVSVGFWRVSQTALAKHDEYKGIKLLGLMVSGPGQIYNNKRDIRSIDDFRGLKLRVANALTAEMAKAFGAVPVTAPAPKTYEILANGVADGTFSSIDAFRSWKLEKLLPYHTQFSGGLFFDTFLIALNQKKWEAISPKDQAAINAISGEAFAVAGGRQWDKMNRLGEELMKSVNTKITVADDAFLAELRKRLKFVEDKWIDVAKSKGIDGAAAIAFLRAQAAEHEKTMK
jgi:TRAP-type C4-dicarboxylate transport system substrate-binding protein